MPNGKLDKLLHDIVQFNYRHFVQVLVGLLAVVFLAVNLCKYCTRMSANAGQVHDYASRGTYDSWYNVCAYVAIACGILILCSLMGYWDRWRASQTR